MACNGEIVDPANGPPADNGSAPIGNGGSSAGSGGSSATTGGTTSSGECIGSTTRRLRRLSLREVQLTLTDLLQTPPETFAWSAPDPKVQGFDTNADSLIVASGSFEDFADVAALAAAAADIGKLAPCAAGADAATCAVDFLTDLARRAYGRRTTEAERQRLLALYTEGATGGDYASGVRLGIEAVLSSPHFLYRTELGAEDPVPTPGATTRLTPEETANALAFAITGARPDATLLARASADPSFLTPAALTEEATRLLATPRANEQLLRFLRQWLGIDDIRSVNKIPGNFPVFTPQMKADFDREVEEYLKPVIAPGAVTLNVLLGGGSGYPSQGEVDAIYAGDYTANGNAVPVAGTFTPITLDPKLRRGIISLPGWLAAHSPVHRSSPVDRGLAIRSRFFCQSLPSPPPGAISTAPGPGDEVQTTRQKFEAHSTDPKCTICHQLMDPVGYGLEMMDAIGRYRQTENNLPVDSHGMLSGTDVDGPFQGPAELADKLKASRMVRDCFTTQVFRYVVGREAQTGDQCAIERLQAAFADGTHTLPELVVQLVSQDQFTLRSYEP
ncbi:MAG: DUF1588 domain-containing protein [Polyangiaceae bacterium]